MARIRSIKPDYWKSESIARLTWEARLAFIALWSYVDDNGVGRDNVRLVAAELFALEDDPAATIAQVQRILDELARESRITRYTHDGRGYLYVNNWDEHQKIDRPNKSRYPKPDDEGSTPLTCGNLNPRESPDEPARVSRESPVLGAVELGSRGAGEQGVPPTAGAAAPRPQPSQLASTNPAPSQADTAQTLAGEWIEHCRKRPPGQTIARVGKHLRELLAEGIDPADVRAGLAQWHTRGLDPSTLPSIVNEVMNAAPDRGRRLSGAAVHDLSGQDYSKVTI